MQLPDSNIWLAVALSGHVHHRVVREWLDSVAGSDEVVFCRATQQSLIRLLSTAAVLAPYGCAPLTNAASWGIYRRLAADDRIGFADEPVGLEPLWTQLACRDTASPKLWMDGYLAAFALAGGYTFVTTDRAFRQHDGLALALLGDS